MKNIREGGEGAVEWDDLILEHLKAIQARLDSMDARLLAIERRLDAVERRSIWGVT